MSARRLVSAILMIVFALLLLGPGCAQSGAGLLPEVDTEAGVANDASGTSDAVVKKDGATDSSTAHDTATGQDSAIDSSTFDSSMADTGTIDSSLPDASVGD